MSVNSKLDCFLGHTLVLSLGSYNCKTQFFNAPTDISILNSLRKGWQSKHDKTCILLRSNCSIHTCLFNIWLFGLPSKGSVVTLL